jgi:FkbM family methyltransferase
MTLAERVLREVLDGSPDGLVGRARLKAAIEARAWLAAHGDPLVRHRIGAAELELPLSHELPLYRHDHPAYDTAIGRIARQAGGPVVDVGANVGDTAAVVRAETDAPILCVEGDDRFFAILRRNAPQLEPVELEHAFVAAPVDPSNNLLLGRVERGAGTARVVAGDEELPAKPLARILEEHARFREPALVKIDTDGMDVPIVLANLDLLARARPVLFFEYDPHLGADAVVFERLREIGYEHAHVYENTGELARTIELPGDGLPEYAGHGGARYADVCALPAGVELEP